MALNDFLKQPEDVSTNEEVMRDRSSTLQGQTRQPQQVSVQPTQQTSIGAPQTPLEGVKTTTGKGLLDLATKQAQKALTGQDFATQQLINRQAEESAATQAALRGASAQRGKLSGLSGVEQDIMANMLDRQLESQRAAQTFQTGQLIGQKAQQAGQQLAQIGAQQQQFEFQKGKDVISDMLAGSDLTDPEQLKALETQYEQTFGVKPTFGALVEQKWDAKQNNAQKDWDAYLIENESLFFDDQGNFNSSFAMGDAAAQDRLREMWNAEWQGMGEEFDMNDPDHRAWAEAQFKKGTTTQETIAFNKLMNDLESNPVWADLPDDVKKDQKAALELLFKGQLVIDPKTGNITDPGGTALVETGMQIIDDKNVFIDEDDETATIDGVEYEFDDGVWSVNGVEVQADDPVLGTLKKSEATITGETDKAKEEVFEFDPATVSTKSVNDAISQFKEGDNIENILNFILDSPSEVEKSTWSKIKDNETILNTIADNTEVSAIESIGGDNGEDGTRPGQRTKYTNPPEIGTVFKLNDGTLIRITSNPVDDNWKKGKRKRYGQKIEYEVLRRPDGSKVPTGTTNYLFRRG